MESGCILYFQKLIEILLSIPEANKSAKGITKQVVWTGVATLAGAVFFGPFGGVVGGLVGSGIGYARSDKYTPLIRVLLDLKDEDKKRVVEAVQNLVGSVSIEKLCKYVEDDKAKMLLKISLENILLKKTD